MKLKCELKPIGRPPETLADLDPGVAAETEYGIRWCDTHNRVYRLYKGYPELANRDNSPSLTEYLIRGRVLGRIEMQFEE